ncbi:hypothetical protein AVEN_3848-1 [Araneus ventricosus]|uniref:Uncharacterized protein n=1 Tax=Araneus ventricosus TaxID=182803 RepID=A0A4Y2GMU1_ARAVE|nr:hypothetical protein AVEN_3848-1 [Araneus ventricosus]
MNRIDDHGLQTPPIDGASCAVALRNLCQMVAALVDTWSGTEVQSVISHGNGVQYKMSSYLISTPECSVRACREGEGRHALGFGTLVKWRESIIFTPRESDPLNFPSSFGRVPVDSSLLEGQDDRCRWQRDKRTPDQEQRGPVTVTSISVRYL